MKPWFLCIGIALLTLGCGSTGEVLQDFDGDGDGWASASSGGQDCDDEDPTQAQAQDLDLDGVSDCAGDCVDTDDTIYPGADEVCDGKDSDGDGTTPEDEIDGDGDGKDDLFIGAPFNAEGGSNSGKTYLFLGASIASGGTFSLSQADAFFAGESPGDLSGSSVSSAGDVDGDGLDDLLIGAAEGGNNAGAPEAGETYLFFGSTVASGGNFNLSVADASFGGENSNDQSG